jgi:hypothetical protein
MLRATIDLLVDTLTVGEHPFHKAVGKGHERGGSEPPAVKPMDTHEPLGARRRLGRNIELKE